MRFISLQKLILITRFILFVFFGFLSINYAKADSCLGGTTSLNAVDNSAFIFSANNTCINVTSTGSKTTSGAQAIYNPSFSGIEIQNAGTLISNGGSYGIQNNGTINLINNSGYISATVDGKFAIGNWGTITTLINSGTIYGPHIWGADGLGTGTGINNTGTITTITNLGSISSSDSLGILSTNSIITLNNAQGGNGANASTTVLRVASSNPILYYNIIINSETHYGQLSLDYFTSGITNFGIYNASTITARLYPGVLQNITNSNLGLNRTGTYDNMNWALSETDTTLGNWNLTFAGVSLAQTQASLAQSAQALRGVYDLQNVAINNNLNNDCSLFDVHGICTSLTGTQNYLSGGVNNDTTSGTLTVAYRVNDNVRIGAYLDQNLNTSNVTGVHLNNGSPAFGAFAVWNANADGLGTQIRVAAGYADKDLTVTRSAVQTSEAGSGTTSLKSYGASAIASYAMAMPGDFIFSPYAGIRYTKVSADAYTEATSSSVTDPLTYTALTQNATTALVGTKWTRRIAENAIAYASIGLEQDLNNNGGTYTATSANIVGLTPIAFNPNINHTRPTASIGSYVNLGDRQRVAANLVWSEEAFTTANATSLMITYMAGF